MLNVTIRKDNHLYIVQIVKYDIDGSKMLQEQHFTDLSSAQCFERSVRGYFAQEEQKDQEQERIEYERKFLVW